jgi:hypothetical protein
LHCRALVYIKKPESRNIVILIISKNLEGGHHTTMAALTTFTWGPNSSQR